MHIMDSFKILLIVFKHMHVYVETMLLCRVYRNDCHSGKYEILVNSLFRNAYKNFAL
jgi:hypothetical protein